MPWLWRGDPTSPASFEKVLSKLSTQITAATLSLDSTRSRARRVKALWTLYTTVLYLLYTLVAALVLGPRQWTVPHYGALIGAPALIYGVREAVTFLFDWRISRQQSHLESLQKQREAKIVELKKATKYDTTQELLQKYSGAPKQSPSKASPQGVKRKANPPAPPGRTGIAPPPTANIPGRVVAPGTPATPQQRADAPPRPMLAHAAVSPATDTNSPATISPDAPGFAPNAFPGDYMRTADYEPQSHWYDRILDVLLGEDETLAKNRLVLLCSNCRLVNGQAPPGVKTLEQLGRWRCVNCRAWNGVESEAAEVVKQLQDLEQRPAADEQGQRPTSRDSAASPADWEPSSEAVESPSADPDPDEKADPDKAEKKGEGKRVDEAAQVSKRVTRSRNSKQQLEDD